MRCQAGVAGIVVELDHRAGAWSCDAAELLKHVARLGFVYYVTPHISWRKQSALLEIRFRDFLQGAVRMPWQFLHLSAPGLLRGRANRPIASPTSPVWR